jgi:hypothetical protein
MSQMYEGNRNEYDGGREMKDEELKDLPDWLQDLWQINPRIARKAEHYIDALRNERDQYKELHDRYVDLCR